MSIVNIILLCILVVAALWTVLTRSLLRSAIALAFTSAVVAALMFRLDAPLAAVFELSVCTGLISVLFISTISLTYPLSQEEKLQHMQERMQRFRWLPVIVVALGIGLSLMTVKFTLPALAPQTQSDMRLVMWDLRPLEIFGQVVILLSGAFGVIILFKEAGKK